MGSQVDDVIIPKQPAREGIVPRELKLLPFWLDTPEAPGKLVYRNRYLSGWSRVCHVGSSASLPRIAERIEPIFAVTRKCNFRPSAFDLSRVGDAEAI